MVWCSRILLSHWFTRTWNIDVRARCQENKKIPTIKLLFVWPTIITRGANKHVTFGVPLFVQAIRTRRSVVVY